MLLQPTRVCECGWRFFNNVADHIPCPKCGFVVSPLVRGQNQNHWQPLHRYAVDTEGTWDPEVAGQWYETWCRGIPQYNCACQANWAEYTWGNPPDFTSPQAFFAWTVTAHNFVSTNHATPRKPPVSLAEAEGLYRAPWIRRRPRGLLTLALDDHSEVLAVTLPLMRQYAERVGAELVVLTDDHRPAWPMANKWRASSYAWQYEQLLYLDSDVIIAPDSPDIFAAVPEGFAARDERPDYHYRPDWYVREADELFASQGRTHTLSHCANGGVLLMTHDTAELYEEPPNEYAKLWCADQHWLSYRMETTDKPVTWLDDRWNWGFIRNDWWRGLADAWFIHLNGSRPLSYRVELAERIRDRNFVKFLPPAEANWAPKHD